MNNCNGEKPGTKIIKIPVHDTITVSEEVIREATVTQYIIYRDTFYYNNSDTVFIDNLPIEYKEYKDSIISDSTKAVIDIKYHGAFAELDSISFLYDYEKEKEIITIPPKKWNFGVTFGIFGGYGYGIGSPNYGTPMVGVGVGIGLQRNFKLK